MDPITTAIIAAAAKLSEPAVKDAYEGLKALILRKVGHQSTLATAVEQAEQKPQSQGRGQTLQEEVAAAGIERDQSILTAAALLIEKIQAVPGGQQLVSQVVTGNQNLIAGRDIINPSIPR
jgi:hypothetical protein